jgi:Fe-S-cluster containining protein
MITASVTLSVGGKPLSGRYTVPSGRATARDLLPAARQMIGQLVDMAVQEVEAAGETISCRKGCGACCRQLVPIAPAEARLMRELVESMPEPRRTEIRQRFAAAREKLAAAGMLDALLEPATYEGSLRKLGLAYFGLGIACPFLEAESCSIHPDRPIACREYLVTSPAEICATPNPQGVRKVPVKGNVVRAVMELEGATTGRVNWVPLVVALEWAERHPQPAETRTGPEMLKEFFGSLSRKKLDLPYGA